MFKISAAIIAFNEEKHIERCLKSLEGVVDEVVVVINSNSTDQTEAICRNFTNKIFIKDFDGYGKQKHYAANLATHDMVLSIDADEALGETLKSEIRDLKKGLPADAYTVNITNYYCGKWMKFGGINSRNRLRIFNRKKGNWSDAEVHERIVLNTNATIVRLNGAIEHIAFESLEEHHKKLHKYTQLSAKFLAEKSFFSIVWKMILSAPSKFFVSYFLKLGLLEGRQGFRFAYMKSFETWLKYTNALKKKLGG